MGRGLSRAALVNELKYYEHGEWTLVSAALLNELKYYEHGAWTIAAAAPSK